MFLPLDAIGYIVLLVLNPPYLRFHIILTHLPALL